MTGTARRVMAGGASSTSTALGAAGSSSGGGRGRLRCPVASEVGGAGHGRWRRFGDGWSRLAGLGGSGHLIHPWHRSGDRAVRGVRQPGRHRRQIDTILGRLFLQWPTEMPASGPECARRRQRQPRLWRSQKRLCGWSRSGRVAFAGLPLQAHGPAVALAWRWWGAGLREAVVARSAAGVLAAKCWVPSAAVPNWRARQGQA